MTGSLNPFQQGTFSLYKELLADGTERSGRDRLPLLLKLVEKSLDKFLHNRHCNQKLSLLLAWYGMQVCWTERSWAG